MHPAGIASCEWRDPGLNRRFSALINDTSGVHENCCKVMRRGIIMSLQCVCDSKLFGRLGLAFVVLFAGGCVATPTTTIHQHPDFENSAKKIEKIALLPLEMGVLRMTAMGEVELQLEREWSLGRDLTKALKDALQAKSYTVIARPEAWPGDEIQPESAEVLKLRSEFSSVAGQFYENAASLEEARQLRVSLGPVVKAVASQQQADALLVARYTGNEKSGGRKAVEVVGSALLAGLTGVSSGPIIGAVGEIRLTLIDGSNGDVLWTNHLSGPTDRKRGTAASRGYYGPADLARKAIAPFPARAVESETQAVLSDSSQARE
jgi:hypothetical protein